MGKGGRKDKAGRKDNDEMTPMDSPEMIPIPFVAEPPEGSPAAVSDPPLEKLPGELPEESPPLVVFDSFFQGLPEETSEMTTDADLEELPEAPEEFLDGFFES